MMRKSFKRVLDPLRSAVNGGSRKGTSIRGGLQQPQRMQALPVRVRSQS
jgi:hypothetical protein